MYAGNWCLCCWAYNLIYRICKRAKPEKCGRACLDTRGKTKLQLKNKGIGKMWIILINLIFIGVKYKCVSSLNF